MTKRFRLGYAPDRFDFLAGALRSRFRAQDLEAAGLLASKEDKSHSWDRFRDRLMFPIFGVSGRIVGFGGRTLGNDPRAAKYLNTPETERFQKRNLLYGLHLARGAVTRARGPAAGRGVLRSPGRGGERRRLGGGLDGDRAHRRSGATRRPLRRRGDRRPTTATKPARKRAAARCRSCWRRASRCAGCGFRPAPIPDSLRLSEGEAALRARVEEAPDAVDLEIDRQPSADRADPHALARAAQRVRQLLTTIPDQVARFAYSRRAATRLGIPHELLWKNAGGNRGRDRGRAEAGGRLCWRTGSPAGASPSRDRPAGAGRRAASGLEPRGARPPASPVRRGPHSGGVGAAHPRGVPRSGMWEYFQEVSRYPRRGRRSTGRPGGARYARGEPRDA